MFIFHRVLGVVVECTTILAYHGLLNPVSEDPTLSHSDWSKLYRSRPNSIAFIVITLTWMSIFIDSNHALFPDFLMDAEEATWACGQMITWIEAGCPSISVK